MISNKMREKKMLLEECAFPEVEQYLETKDTILIPVGAVEQHSPYGLIGTDFIAAETITREVGKRLSLMVAPTLQYGISPHHLDFAGSATLHPDTFINLCCDLIRSFSHHGFKRIFFINGHGGNRHGLQTAFQKVKMENVAGIFAMFSWYECTGVKRFNTRCFEKKEGKHATPSEVSVTMHARPDAFDNKPEKPKEVEYPETYWPMTAREMKKVFPDGRMESAPWLASAETGAAIFSAAVEDLCKKVLHYLEMELI